jgi:integrase
MENTMDKISETIVEALPAPERGNRLHYFSGAKLQRQECPVGFAVRVTASGARSFVLFYRHKGKAHLDTIGRHDRLSVLDAIKAAQARVEAIRQGVDPKPARTLKKEEKAKPVELTVEGLLDEFVKRHVTGKLRSAKIIMQAFKNLVKPEIGDIKVRELKRSRVVQMLNKIADEQGEVQSDRVLSYLRKALNWHEVYGGDDDFRSPIVRGMARTKPSEHARDRILDDDELRALWRATDDSMGPFGAMLRFVLLTACRRSEAANMPAYEVDGDDWTIPPSRYKTGKEHIIPLSEAAQDILNALPVNGDFVFTIKGGRPIKGFSQLKIKVDAQCSFSDWCIHDLRRTARSLMARAGIQSDIAERCLGHAIPGIRGTYDRYEYHQEKAAAFEALAALVSEIVMKRAGA